MNDADRFVWMVKHFYMFQIGISGATLKYTDDKRAYSEYYFNYEKGGIADIGKIDDVELMRMIVDRIVENETNKTRSE